MQLTYILIIILRLLCYIDSISVDRIYIRLYRMSNKLDHDLNA